MNKKVILGIIILIVIVAVVLGLIIVDFKKTDYSNITISTKEIQDKIIEKFGEEMPAMVDVDEIGIKDIYKINNDIIDNFDIRYHMIDIKVCEIAIVKVKNLSDVELIKEKFKDRSIEVANNFEKYLPDQYQVAKNPIIKSKDKYVIMIMSDIKEEIEKVFDNFFIK